MNANQVPTPSQPQETLQAITQEIYALLCAAECDSASTLELIEGSMPKQETGEPVPGFRAALHRIRAIARELRENNSKILNTIGYAAVDSIKKQLDCTSGGHWK